jgi:C1A family cysteine protease
MSLITATTSTGDRLPAIVTPDGRTRILGAIPTGGLKAAAPAFASANPVIPRSEWQPTRRPRGGVPILNQGSHGSCVGHGSCRALMKARERTGATFVLLSPTFVYAQINGGWDRGSDPADAATTLLQTGTCTMAECGEDTIFKRGIPQSAYQTAGRFKALDIYQCHSFDESVSAWLIGFDVFDTVNVGAGFNNLDSNGVPPVAPGNGNHCVMFGDELKVTSGGTWLMEHANSWDTSWGQDGFFFMREAHYDRQPDWQAFAIRAVGVDPQDPANIPG